jgi:hypothetical protein
MKQAVKISDEDQQKIDVLETHLTERGYSTLDAWLIAKTIYADFCVRPKWSWL